MSASIKYQVSTRSTPGARMTVDGQYVTLAQARKAALDDDRRKDLTYQDVRIERLDGVLVEYAGQSR